MVTDLFGPLKFWVFCKYDSKLKVKYKTNPWFFFKLSFVIFTPKVRIIYKNAIFFENKFFTLSSSFSSSICNIVISINTQTTMYNQFEALNAHKNRFLLLLSHFLWTKNNISFTFSLYSSKNPKILILNFLRFIEPFKLMIRGH